jgi:hypothetical protein
MSMGWRMREELMIRNNNVSPMKKKRRIRPVDPFAVEEYKALRAEMLRHQEDVVRVLEFGLATVGVLAAFPFVNGLVGHTDPKTREYVVNISLLIFYLYLPPFLVAPLISLIAHRVRQSWKINYYIRNQLEPNYDIHWETFSRETSNTKKRKSLSPRYIMAASSAFLITQIVMPVISIYLLIMHVAETGIQENLPSIIMSGILIIVLIMLLIYEFRILMEADAPGFE